MKTPLVNKDRVEKRIFKTWILVAFLVSVSLLCFRSNELRKKEEVQLGMNPNEASAPAAAPPDASGGSSSNAQPGPSSSNSGDGSATQSNPASEPPQQYTHMSTRSMHRIAMSRGRENMAMRSAGPLLARRSAGPLPGVDPIYIPDHPIEPSTSSHTFPEASGSSLPPSDSPEREALEGLLHIDLPSSLGQQQQQTEPIEQETVEILDADYAPRGPGRRTQEGLIQRDESSANADDVREVLDLVLAMNPPRKREALRVYDARILKVVKQTLRENKGLTVKSAVHNRNWWAEKVKFAYDMHKGAGPSTSASN